MCHGICCTTHTDRHFAFPLCCRELTYPDPRGILRLTLVVLAASAILSALVWSIDRAFAALLLPPIARRMSSGAV